MNEDKALKILKEAILLERRGHAFYKKISDQSDKLDVKEFFQMMADEEIRHIEVLSEQFKAYQTHSRFAETNQESLAHDSVAIQVLSEKIRKGVAAADFEAAAIGAAMSMEERAIEVYSERATASKDEKEKALYQWLAEWERGHLKLLTDIDKVLREQIWFDNGFWPF